MRTESSWLLPWNDGICSRQRSIFSPASILSSAGGSGELDVVVLADKSPPDDEDDVCNTK